MTPLHNKLLSQEQYKAVCISTGDIPEADMDKLAEMGLMGQMVTTRDTGYFIKLFEEAEYNDEEYSALSATTKAIFSAAHEIGFRMIEIDCDVLCMGDEPLWC
jgi:hypothetical protein